MMQLVHIKWVQFKDNDTDNQNQLCLRGRAFNGEVFISGLNHLSVVIFKLDLA